MQTRNQLDHAAKDFVQPWYAGEKKKWISRDFLVSAFPPYMVDNWLGECVYVCVVCV